MPTRNASAEWNGGLKSGKGTYKVGTAGLGGSYSAGSRFAEEGGSNPEELLAAAEAACYSMALSGALERNGTPPQSIRTNAECTIEKVNEAWQITKMKLDVSASAPGIDDAKFQELANATLTGCPVSKAFKGNVQLEVNAKLI
jgi:osmotically inducible protein OsmC